MNVAVELLAEANPFVRKGEITFMRHDEVRVVQQRPGLVAVEFRWRGVLTYTMYVDCDFAASQTLTLAGITSEAKNKMSDTKEVEKSNNIIHDWVADGVSIHNGEYWYKCSKCGASDWIASYGTVDQLMPKNCKNETL